MNILQLPPMNRNVNDLKVKLHMTEGSNEGYRVNKILREVERGVRSQGFNHDT